MRPDKHTYYLRIAAEVSSRSSCLRSAYGAVIVKNDTIKSTGYNGSCRGGLNCCDIGKCRRENAPTRTGYEVCPALHGEENSALQSQTNLEGSTIYISAFDLKVDPKAEKLDKKALPCWRCYRILINCGIIRVCVKGEDGNPRVYGIEELKFVDPISFSIT